MLLATGAGGQWLLCFYLPDGGMDGMDLLDGGMDGGMMGGMEHTARGTQVGWLEEPLDSEARDTLIPKESWWSSWHHRRKKGEMGP